MIMSFMIELTVPPDADRTDIQDRLVELLRENNGDFYHNSEVLLPESEVDS